jgi:hypothetical protein
MVYRIAWALARLLLLVLNLKKEGLKKLPPKARS